MHVKNTCCKNNIILFLLSDSSRWVYSQPSPPSWHGKYEVRIFVSTVFFSVTVPGGCCSQGCHGYPMHLARIDS